MAIVTGPVPEPGRLVGCWFPYKDRPEQPGKKFRPCFVMGANNEFGVGITLCVAYGTGQKTSDKSKTVVRDWEFELDANEGGNRLTEQTRFDCFNHVWLPYTVEWFCKDNKMGSTYGSIPKNRADVIRGAMEKGQLKAASIGTRK